MTCYTQQTGSEPSRADTGYADGSGPEGCILSKLNVFSLLILTLALIVMDDQSAAHGLELEWAIPHACLAEYAREDNRLYLETSTRLFSSHVTLRSSVPQPRDDRVLRIGNRDFSQFGIEKGIYDLPIDDAEETRQDELNSILLGRFSSLVLVPFPPEDIDAPTVLDCGYGGGAWIDKMLEQHEDCVITGVDLNIGEDTSSGEDEDEDEDAIQEFFKKRWNLNAPFSSDTSDTRLRPESFDLINCRCMAEGIERSRWPVLVTELKRLLKPGGRIQFVEPYYCFQSDNGRLSDASASNAWWEWYKRYMDLRGRDARIGRNLERYCRAAGLEQVAVTQYRLPIGGWEPGRGPLGRSVRRAVTQLFAALAIPFIRTGQITPDLLRLLTSRATDELSRDENKPYFVVYVVTAMRRARR